MTARRARRVCIRSNRPAEPTRLDLARWLVDKRNPLTARVTVNRMWQQYFGKGIVETENDFGTAGRQADASGTARLAGHRVHGQRLEPEGHSPADRDLGDLPAVVSKRVRTLEEADPDNRLLARQNRLRLEAEIIRDAALVASGLLDAEDRRPERLSADSGGAITVTQVKREWPTATGPDRYRRGMYTFFQRSAAHPGAAGFRCAGRDRDLHAPRPLQHAAAGADFAER